MQWFYLQFFTCIINTLVEDTKFEMKYTELLGNCLDDLIAMEQYELCAEIKKILDKKSKRNGDALELIRIRG